ncbi:FUSC family protein, partial [Amycolatopsis cihanbeyliensis]
MRGVGMPVVLLVVVGGTSGLGFLLGLGNAAILAGLTALFCLLASFGGPLGADLRLLAVLAPALLLGVGVPKLLAGPAPAAAIALLTVVVFGAALLPVLGPRFAPVGLGLGMASLFGYGFQLTGSATAGQILGAPALAIGVVLLLRVLSGIRDPSGPTRKALADALAEDAPGTAEHAGRVWLSERPVQWTTRVLGGILRLRTLTAILEGRRKSVESGPARELGEILGVARRDAAALADSVRARTAPAEPEPVRRGQPGPLPGGTGRLVTALWSTLESIREASRDRDRSRVELPRGLRREVRLSFLRGTVSWGSPQLRHAVRCALGVLLALLIAHTRPGDPLTVSFLLTTFGIMQPEWRDSLEKAWQRVAGSLAGAVVLALALWLLPSAALLPVAVVAMLVGLSLMRRLPLVFNGCVVLMAVGMNAASGQLDAGYLLVEYLLLMLLAVVVGLLFGFAAIPGVGKPDVRRRWDRALRTGRDLLEEAAAPLRGQDTAGDRLDHPLRAAALAA